MVGEINEYNVHKQEIICSGEYLNIIYALIFFIVSIITLEAHHECIFNIFTKCNFLKRYSVYICKYYNYLQ